MSDDPDFADAAAALTERATFDGTVSLDGTRYPIRVQEPQLGELEAIEAELPDDAEEVDAAREMVDRYLLEPDIDASNLGLTRAMALFGAMRETWEQADAFQDAVEAMPLDDEGNANR